MSVSDGDNGYLLKLAERRKGRNEGIFFGYVAGICVGALMTYFIQKDNTATSIPVGVGVPKGYHITNVKIPTKGAIDTVWFLPNEEYKITELSCDKKTYHGDFKYHIKPNILFAPKDDLHSDKSGNTTYGPSGYKYWEKVKDGVVTLQLDKDALEQKLK